MIAIYAWFQVNYLILQAGSGQIEVWVQDCIDQRRLEWYSMQMYIEFRLRNVYMMMSWLCKEPMVEERYLILESWDLHHLKDKKSLILAIW